MKEVMYIMLKSFIILLLMFGFHALAQANEHNKETSDYALNLQEVEVILEEAAARLKDVAGTLESSTQDIDIEVLQDSSHRLINRAVSIIDQIASHHNPRAWNRPPREVYQQFRSLMLHPDGTYLGVSLVETDEKPSVGGFIIDPDATSLETGDVLISINGVVLDQADNQIELLRTETSKVEAGEKVSMVVERNGQLVELEVPTWSHSELNLPEPVSGAIMHDFHGPWTGSSSWSAPGTLAREVTYSPGVLHVIDVEDQLASYFDVEEGVLVVTTPKKQDDIRAGDIILKVGEIESKSAREVNGILGFLEQPVELTVMRNGKQRKISINPKRLNRSHDEAFWRHNFQMLYPDRRRDSQLQLIDLNDDLSTYFDVDDGILVVNTRRKSELQPGDIIEQIGGIPVDSATQTNGILRQLSDPVSVNVRRAGKALEVMLEPLPRTQMRTFFDEYSRDSRGRPERRR